MKTCPICGDELKVITVWVPVYERMTARDTCMSVDVLVRYEEREEVCDCPRCQGGY